ncbi:MAG: hypothetical protein J2P50_19365 [Hyphomicrobiaceae bacterium]|nr:hypothetical protein [Hyphomicrobiaceae bacterium]
MLFLLKIAVTPLLVAGVSLAVRWWGPTVGGILMGLPWFTGPVLFILIQDQGITFGVGACAGVLIGVVSISAFMLAYGLAAAVARWPLSLAAAVTAYGASVAATSAETFQRAMGGVAPPLWAAAAMGAVSLCVVLALLPRPEGEVRPPAPPWWDLPARMMAAAALVTVLVVGAEPLGPRLAGIFASYPIILTITGVFTHYSGGRDAVLRVLRGLAVSLFGFIAFFLVLGLALPVVGAIGAYALAATTGLAITAALVAAHRARLARQARSAHALRLS